MMWKKHTKSDADIQKAICGTPAERDDALYYFFRNPTLKPLVKQFVLDTEGGTHKDYEDVFQEAFILFDRNIREGKFKGDSSLKTYFVGIARIVWLRHKHKAMPVDAFDIAVHDAETAAFDHQIIANEQDTERQQMLDAVLSKMGEKCKELLLLTGIAASNDEIARLKGYANADSAKKEVYRCREKFRNFIKEHPQIGAILKRKN